MMVGGAFVYDCENLVNDFDQFEQGSLVYNALFPLDADNGVAV